MSDFAKRCEIEALKVEALGLLIDNIGRLVTSGMCEPARAKDAAVLAARMRALAEETAPADPLTDPLELADAIIGRDAALRDLYTARAQLDQVRAHNLELTEDLQRALRSENARREERDSARAEVERMKQKLQAEQHNYGVVVDEYKAEVERLKREREELRQQLSDTRETTDRKIVSLRQELTAAQDRLPAWAKRVTAGTLRCLSAKGWSAQAETEIELRKAVSDLTSDQRRQCEES